MASKKAAQKSADKKTKQSPPSQRRALFGVVAAGLGAALALLVSFGHIMAGVSGLSEVITHLPWLSTHPTLEQTIVKLAGDVRMTFAAEADLLERTKVADFLRTKIALEQLKKVDDRNGHVWYFQGEVKRMSLHERFERSCVKDFGSDPKDFLGSYHNDFLRYIEIEDSLPPDQTKGSMDRKPCADRPNGFCVQRTAWISHLLANDYYRMAVATEDTIMRKFRLQHAIEAINRALRYRRPDGDLGFPQCIPTITLKTYVDKELQTLQ